jgi:hypothetical protein
MKQDIDQNTLQDVKQGVMQEAPCVSQEAVALSYTACRSTDRVSYSLHRICWARAATQSDVGYTSMSVKQNIVQ